MKTSNADQQLALRAGIMALMIFHAEQGNKVSSQSQDWILAREKLFSEIDMTTEEVIDLMIKAHDKGDADAI